MSRIQRELALLSMMFVSTLLGLSLGEIAVRHLAPQDMLSNFSWYESSTDYKYKHRPNMEKLARWGDVYHLRTNSAGLREDREIELAKGEKWRIAILGDSFVFGNGVEKRDLFATRLEQLLNRGAKGCTQAVNFGVSAFGPGQELMYYRKFVSRYDPDVVILGVYMGNDVTDDLRDGLFKLDGTKLTHVPYRISLMKSLTDTSWYQWLASNSQLFILMRRSVSQFLENRTRTASPGNSVATDQSGPPSASTEVRFKEALSTTAAIWREFVREVRANNATPILLMLPSKSQIFAHHGVNDGKDETHLAISSHQILKDICTDEGLLCVDMLDHMEPNDIGTLFIKEDFHYNAAGHELISNELYEIINGNRPGQANDVCN